MDFALLPRPLRGVIPPLVTPLKDRDTLDAAGLERLIEHVLGGGVHGIFVLGTTGEAPSLSYRLRAELIERTCRQVGGRVPVLAGITDTAFVESVRLARKASDAGAAAVVLAPPYYFPAGQEELLEYVEHLVPELPLPLFLYNMPGMTKVSFDPATVRKAAELPAVAGLKDSSSNMVYFHKVARLMQERPGFTLLVGPEELLGEAVLLGAHGGVTGGANIHPSLYVELYEVARRRDVERVAVLHARVIELATKLYGVGRHGSSFIKGIKCSLSLLGICDDFMAEPFHRFRREEREVIRARLEDLGLLPRI
jgi:4-hydroxy-tetrahydrodipicolinate synthase